MQQKNYDSSEIIEQLLDNATNDPKSKGNKVTTAKQDGVTNIRNPYIKNKSIGGVEEYEFSFCSFDNTKKYYHLEIPEEQVEILFDFCFNFRAVKPKAKGLSLLGKKDNKTSEVKEVIASIEKDEEIPF